MRPRVVVLLLLAAIVLYLALWPVPVDPVAWDAPVDAGFAGPFARNERLHELELLPVGGDHGPETIDVDAGGRVYTGTKEGRILRDGQVGRAGSQHRVRELAAKILGKPLRDYLRQKQLTYAAWLLRTLPPEITVEEIALRSALGPPRTFHLCFLEAYGTTPGAFRGLKK